ncbi:hypothetical protein GCE86_09530 [Micromonospora terminaliae]|uniref:DUF7919 domain-containing protein n=1 Tax=Micromonospora terminaliae TaxID=1914461 RepID=A0AAJ2ZES6_9ACTN|nr:hypothetical protein [Micromonospora terminaliae]NES27984.1 hypothetical protein [Micromonospora terminaliae]QGL47254.1 hypothetical protein GCE86_09530 [Micromonospora terminaliae]
MTYFADLDIYTYSPLPEDGKQTLCVGWLDAAHGFPQGKTPERFRDVLARLCATERVAATRGLHQCNLSPRCAERPPWPPIAVTVEGRETFLGSAEIRASADGVVYAAPDLIVHYVNEHDYRPPDEFVRAVLRSAEHPRLAT